MKKIFTLFVATLFTTSLAFATAPAIETQWNLSVANGNTAPSYLMPYAWNKSQRSMKVYEGKLYISNMFDTNIAVVDPTTGAFIEDINLSYLPSDVKWFKNCINFTDDGYVILGSSGTGSTYFIFYVCDLRTGSLVQKVQVDMAAIGRADYFSVYGKLNGTEEEEGYIALASNSGNVTTIPMFGGAISNKAVMPFPVAAGYTGAASAMTVVKDANSFFVLGRSITSRLYDRNSYESPQFIKTELAPIAANSGGTYFEYNEREYLVVASNGISAFKILDVTDGVASATEVINGNYALGTVDNGTSIAMTVFASEVKEDCAMIYVLSSSNGVAAYKFVTDKPIKEVVETPVLTPSSGSFAAAINVEITSATAGAVIRYTLDGTEPTEDSEEYTAAIEITKTTTVKAKAWLAGSTASEIVEATYTITTTGIDVESQDAARVYGENEQIIVESAIAGDIVVVYNLQGQKVTTLVTEQGVSRIPVAKGVYIVKVGAKSTKVAL